MSEKKEQRPRNSGKELEINTLLKAMIQYGASDLHLSSGSPPQLRVDGRLRQLRADILRPADTKRLCLSILSERQREAFKERNDFDVSFGVEKLARFRANIFRQRGAVAGSFRKIPYEVPKLNTLGVPDDFIRMVSRPNGLVLVTGPTGAGKSTTLAAVIDKINAERHCHIVTIEDPIEYLHSHKKSLVNQREVGADTDSFRDALKYVLRQDPDVILIGEMRDIDTVEAALALSETGHLVLGTLHTNSAVQTISRVVNMFPSDHRSHIRNQLGFVLQAVLSQQLVPKIGGGMTLATELMVCNLAIKNLIREDKLHQMSSQIQMGKSSHAMHTMNSSLLRLYRENKITLDDARSRTSELDDFDRALQNLAK